MPDWREMFGGRYISAEELGEREVNFTIGAVNPIKVTNEDGTISKKPEVLLKGTDRFWLLNKTNAACVAAMFGNDTRAWTDKRVTLLSAMVRVGKETKPGIRIKGSPDLSGPVELTIRHPKKKPETMTMQVTK